MNMLQRIGALSQVVALTLGAWTASCSPDGLPPEGSDAATASDAAGDAASPPATDAGPDPQLLCSCDSVCPVADDTIAGPVAFADVQAIMSNHCSSGACHVGGSMGLTLDMRPGSTCASTVGFPAVETAETTMLARVAPGDPDASYLYNKIRGTHEDVGGSGCKMPFGECCLPATDIGAIRRWIAEGASCN